MRKVSALPSYLADAGARGFQVHQGHVPETLDGPAGGEQAEGEVVFLGLHEEVSGKGGTDGFAPVFRERFERGGAEGGAGADENVGIGGGFAGAIGQGDIEDGRRQ